MKASQLIEKLTEYITKYGDLDVKVYPYDGQMNPGLLDEIVLVNKRIKSWNEKTKDWETEPCDPFVLLE